MVRRYEQIRGTAAGQGNSVEIDGDALRPREDLVRTWGHCYDWGRVSHGAWMLAVAILAVTFDDKFAADHYRRFTVDVLAELPCREFTLARDRVLLWRRSIEPDDSELAGIKEEAAREA